MTTHETVGTAEDERNTSQKFLTLLILGFSMMMMGLLFVAIGAVLSQGGSTSFSAVIFIGPIPIVFGAGPGAQWLILFAIILAVLSVIMFLTVRRKPKNTKV